MTSRPLQAAAVIYCWLASAVAPARAVEIYAQLFPLTGEVRLVNRDAAPIPLVYYSITSAGGALNGNVEIWKSISEHYDVSGNGLVDPAFDWFVLADDPDELTEAVFSGPGGSLPPMRAISLGQIWDPFAVPFPDLVFDIQNDEEPIPVTVELALDGDYSLNQVVDAADYVLWRTYLNSTTILLADGDLDGVIDSDDYEVWQENFGLTLPLPPYGSGSGSQSLGAAQTGAVPEPACVVLLLISLGGWFAVGNRRCR